MESLIQLIPTVGFPIVAFFICVYALKYAYDKSREDNKAALAEISKLTEAVNNNSAAIADLVKEIQKPFNS